MNDADATTTKRSTPTTVPDDAQRLERRHLDDCYRAQIANKSGPAWEALKVDERRKREDEERRAALKASRWAAAARPSTPFEARVLAEGLDGEMITPFQWHLADAGQIELVIEQLHAGVRKRAAEAAWAENRRIEDERRRAFEKIVGHRLPGAPPLPSADVRKRAYDHAFATGVYFDDDNGGEWPDDVWFSVEHLDVDYRAIAEAHLDDADFHHRIGNAYFSAIWEIEEKAFAKRPKRAAPEKRTEATEKRVKVDYRARVVDLLTENEEWPSTRQVFNAVKGPQNAIAEALASLVADGTVTTKPGARGAVRHQLAE